MLDLKALTESIDLGLDGDLKLGIYLADAKAAIARKAFTEAYQQQVGEVQDFANLAEGVEIGRVGAIAFTQGQQQLAKRLLLRCGSYSGVLVVGSLLVGCSLLPAIALGSLAAIAVSVVEE